MAATCVITTLASAPRPACAQHWNDARTLTLVDLAISRRAAQLADTGLVDYRASAHGYLTFLAQIGEGFPDPPKVVRTDELALEVYWRSPNQSKQRIIGRRDTLLLPTDINYHRDHLAIVQNNFPSIIRLGDGDEVRDVPHPLSAAGRGAYDFAIADSLLIRTSDRAFDVMMVRVRPRDDRLPRAVGAVYLDRASGAVVRMTFSFTRAALKDQQLEDVNVILESALVDGRFWLPRRQEIEITRSSTWMEFPARGIIRGRWEICCVTVNESLPAPLFAGPEVVSASPSVLKAYPFKGGILEHLPADVRLSDSDDIRRIQAEARELVRAEALARSRRTAPSAASVTDVVRMNRVEGIAIGGGLSRRLGAGLSADVRARFGFADHEPKGVATLRWERASGVGIALSGGSDSRPAGDVAETSGIRNSLAAQEFGSDFTDLFRTRGATLAVDAGAHLGIRWRLSLAQYREDPLVVHARPVLGQFAPALAATPLARTTLAIGAAMAERDGPAGSRIRASADIAIAHARIDTAGTNTHRSDFGRVSAELALIRAVGADRFALAAYAAAAVGPEIPRQSLAFFGGPVTGPGYDFHQFAARAGLSARVEWRHLAATVPVSLGRFGSLAMPVTVAPFAQGIWLHRRPGKASPYDEFYPALGVGVLSVFDVVRFDVAHGLREGKWTFGVDLAPEFWRIF